ncbi:uncharacterized protein LOC131948976 [Physella acuta]|uniref:uncharacterized protein LOC131948976 n=1 Tax=Physella acuta TaxID=109671 RepID=UPI0027DD169D|nr:uncharacterized protein LOC131948976 [Physella acuta]
MDATFLGFVFSILVWIRTGFCCDMLQVQGCNHYDQIRESKFHGFIAQRLLNRTCSELSEALSCVYKPEVAGGCSDKDILSFSVQWGVVKHICSVGREDYRRSFECFSYPPLMSAVQKCESIINTAAESDVCSELPNYRTCVDEATTTVSEGCLLEHLDLMKHLTELYIEPVAKAYQCSDVTFQWDLTTAAPTTPNEPDTISLADLLTRQTAQTSDRSRQATVDPPIPVTEKPNPGPVADRVTGVEGAAPSLTFQYTIWSTVFSACFAILYTKL